jgi:hypothetical protein
MKPEDFKEWFRGVLLSTPKEQLKAELAEARANGDQSLCICVQAGETVSLSSGSLDLYSAVPSDAVSELSGWSCPLDGRFPKEKSMQDLRGDSSEEADSYFLGLAA